MLLEPSQLEMSALQVNDRGESRSAHPQDTRPQKHHKKVLQVAHSS